MRVELLGPGRVDGEVDALTPRDRVVLMALAIHRGRSVSVDGISAALWGEAAPASRVKVVQGCISRLRKRLGPDAIVTERDGYRLALDDDEVDIRRFARLVERGRRLVASQRPDPAAEVLAEALGLWSTPTLPEVDDWDAGRSERQRLVELHAVAEELRVDALLLAGRPREALPEAARLVQTEPLRESRWELLARARYQCGRQADALATIDEARDILARELGLDVGPGLEILQRRILRHDDVLAVADPPASARQGRAAALSAPAIEVTAGQSMPGRGSRHPRGSRRTAGALLERDGDLARLHHELSTAADDGGRVVLVRGEAGIGKSMLVSHFLAAVAEDAATYLGGCDDLETPQPWAPLWDVARDRPDLAAALESRDRRRVMGATLDLLTPAGGPGVLVIEDTQWADDATLDVIMYVGRRIDRASGILLLTYRDGAVDDDHPLRRIFGALPATRVARLSLEPLSLEAVRAMIGDGSRDARRLRDVTGGNPLFVTEMLAVGPDEVPRSVQDAVLARLSALSPRSRQLVELVSAVPGQARWATVERVLGADDPGTRQAVRHGLLAITDDGVAFRHELQRRAVEASLTPPARRRLHRRVLVALGDDADPARLAYHARHAGDTDALLVHAARAGRRALSAHSHSQAVEHFASLAAHVDAMPADEAANVLEGWARAQWHLGASGAAEVVERAVALRRTAGDPGALSRTLSFGAFVLQVDGRGEDGAAWAAEAVALVEQSGPSADLAYALTEQARVLISVGPAGPVAQRAAAIAEAVGDARTACSALILVGASAMKDDPEAGLAILERARACAHEGGHHFEEADACMFLGRMRMAWFGDLEQAADALAQSRRLAAEHEFLDLLGYVDAIVAVLHVRQGRWRRAEQVATAVLGTGIADALMVAETVLALLETRRGRSGAEATLQRLWARATELGMPHYHEGVAAVLAEHLWLERVHEGPSWAVGLDSMLRRFLRDPPRNDFGRLLFWGAMAGLLPEQPTGIDDGFSAVLDGARTAEAAALWHERGWPYEEAIALLHGTNDEAVRAVRILEDLGADGTIARARQLLRDRGITVPRGRSRAARHHAAGLTERQAEVLGLLADGVSNGEIADELFISRRTVETHVAEILRKLAAGDREEAVTTARTRGLL